MVLFQKDESVKEYTLALSQLNYNRVGLKTILASVLGVLNRPLDIESTIDVVLKDEEHKGGWSFPFSPTSKNSKALTKQLRYASFSSLRITMKTQSLLPPLQRFWHVSPVQDRINQWSLKLFNFDESLPLAQVNTFHFTARI
jgi:hypothetical protein